MFFFLKPSEFGALDGTEFRVGIIQLGRGSDGAVGDKGPSGASGPTVRRSPMLKWRVFKACLEITGLALSSIN